MKLSLPLQFEGVIPSILPVSATSRPRMLFVSETQQSHDAIRNVLTRSGWTVASKFEVSEALRLVDRDEVAVIVCDCKLPCEGCKELLKKAQQSDNPARFIGFCKPAEMVRWRELLQAGAFDLISYPFDSQELIRVTSQAWESWLGGGVTALPDTGGTCPRA